MQPRISGYSSRGSAARPIARSHRNYLAGPIVYGAAMLIAFVEPYVSIGIYAALAVYWLLPRIGPRAELVQHPVARIRED
jgi:hypothetical protein